MVHESGLMWEELIQISMRRVRNLPQMCEYAYCGKCNCLLAFTPRFLATNGISQSWEMALTTP